MSPQSPLVVPGTGEVPGIDLESVVPWLLDRVAGLEPPLAFSRVGDGQSNLTFRVDDAAGRALILRRPPLGEILASAHDMGREYRILGGLEHERVATPRPLAICEDVAVTGAPFYVMDHLDGHVLTTVSGARRLSIEARHATGRALARTLVDLQSVDIDRAGLGDMRRPSSLRDRQIRRWHRQWEASRTRDLPMVDALARRLSDGLPDECETVIVHGDYRLDNVVFSGEGEALGVLDWELCSVGDPLADLGLMVAYWDEQGAVAGTDEGLFRESVTSVPGMIDSDRLIEEYAAASGRNVDHVGGWIAFSYWKIAIIVEGVYRRWLNNPANGSGAGALGVAVERLIRRADEAARAASI